MMQDEGGFPRLVELIGDQRDDGSGLYRMLLELMFEMARIQKLDRDDMGTVLNLAPLHVAKRANLKSSRH